jgi:RsiW-degrading membrane proteinase PrsW (M82 family)
LTTTNILPLSILAAIIPALFFTGLIYWVDRYEKEPAWLLAATFLWGAVPSVLFALFFNALFSTPLFLLTDEATAETLAASLVGPLVEESVKGVMLLAIFFWWRDEIDSPLDGIIYGAMVGMGFAVVENIFYFVTIFAEGGREAWNLNIVMRGVVFGLNHALFTSMTGLGVALARMSVNRGTRIVAPIAGWLAAVLLHAFHNLSVSFNNLVLLCAVVLVDWGGVWLTVAIIVWALYQERRWIRTYLADEVDAGLMTQAQFEMAGATLDRARYRFAVLRSSGLKGYLQAGRFLQRLSKLAYQKHHQLLFADERSGRAIEQLRGEIRELQEWVA